MPDIKIQRRLWFHFDMTPSGYFNTHAHSYSLPVVEINCGAFAFDCFVRLLNQLCHLVLTLLLFLNTIDNVV